MNKLKVGENFLAQNEQMADGVYNHFMGIMGSPGQQLCSIDLTQLGPPLCALIFAGCMLYRGGGVACYPRHAG